MKDLVKLLDKAEWDLIDVSRAQTEWQKFREKNGLHGHPALFTDDENGNMKLHKSANQGFRTLGLTLAHDKTSGEYNVCRFATRCRDYCVSETNHGRRPKVKFARAVKTQFLAHNPSAFITLLVHEIDRGVKKHGNLAVRMNVFSDLPWERWIPWFFERWESVKFYDYTRWPLDQRPGHPLYDLTRSITENHDDSDIVRLVESGERVSVIARLKRKDPVPETFLGFDVIDGDKHDARFSEPKGVVVILRPKGSIGQSDLPHAIA